jgi:hypothetical protein
VTLLELIALQERYSLVDCHLVYVGRSESVIAHPSVERRGDETGRCPYAAWVARRVHPPAVPGRVYLITRYDNEFGLVHMPRLLAADAPAAG